MSIISSGGSSSRLAPPRIMPLLRGPLIAGLLIVALFFGIFGGWAAYAPLASGAISAGVVSPESSRKVIQHLEGGIVRAMHVREGQQVKAGDPLVTLESTRAAATLSAGRDQWLRLLVVRARLEAHTFGADDMTIPQAVLEADEPDLQAFIDNQRGLFDTQKRSQEQQAQISVRQIEQMNIAAEAYSVEGESLARQKDLLDSQLADVEQLLSQQLISRTNVTAMQADQAQLDSSIASNRGRVAQVVQSIEESRLTLLQSQETFRIQTAQEMTEVNNQIAVLAADIESSADVLRRTEIISPVDGIVLNIRNETIGGIVGPGEPIMDVVPLNDDMIILARLSPRDIDIVTVGLKAHVTLLPFASRNLLPLNGEVIQIAPDSTLDELTRQYYYELRVRVPASELTKHEGLYMSPGMPADVTVVTGARTMVQYLAEPLMRAIRTAFVYD